MSNFRKFGTSIFVEVDVVAIFVFDNVTGFDHDSIAIFSSQPACRPREKKHFDAFPFEMHTCGAFKMLSKLTFPFV
jgi:hypothetical protein